MKNFSLPDSLLSDFPNVGKQQWKEKAIEDLNGADYNKKLVWHPLDPFEVDPYYTRDENNELEYLRHFIYTGDKQHGPHKPRHWLNVPVIYDSRTDHAVHAAVEMVESGADGVYFDFSEKDDADIASVAYKILPLKCYAVYKANGQSLQKLTDSLLNGKSSKPLNIKARGRINFDPVQQRTLTGNWDAQSVSMLADLITALKPYPDFHALTINGSHLCDSGASASQEIAYVLSTMVDYLDMLTGRNIPATDIIESLCFETAIGSSFFMEIAKIRALRILASNILAQYTDAPVERDRLFVHSISSLWTKTVFDPYVNILRNTTEAMSAILGGCNALTIAPHDVRFGRKEGSSQRITKNISIILKEESFFDKTADPAAGSYYIEQLTDKLVQSALQLFLDTEAEGGFMASFSNGKVQDTIRLTREIKDKHVTSRRTVYVGTNQYPNVHETVDPNAVANQSREADDNAAPELLRPRSGAQKIEMIRLKTEQWIQRSQKQERPGVYLSLIGQNAVMRSARATFSANFMGCAGFEIQQGPLTDSLDAAVSKALEADAEITVVCGADEDYQAGAVQYAEKYKSGKPTGMLILAGHPGILEDSLRAAGFDQFIHVRADLLETLHAVQQQLDIK